MGTCNSNLPKLQKQNASIWNSIFVGNLIYIQFNMRKAYTNKNIVMYTKKETSQE